jgi:hypothetical protein
MMLDLQVWCEVWRHMRLHHVLKTPFPVSYVRLMCKQTLHGMRSSFMHSFPAGQRSQQDKAAGGGAT